MATQVIKLQRLMEAAEEQNIKTENRIEMEE
jgi:hypothetical protein